MLSFLSSFLAGIVAAFTPCAAVLIPIVSYRFLRGKMYWKGLLLFLLGFISLYLISAKFLSGIFESNVRNGFQVGLGMLFVVLGFLEIRKRFNPLNFPLIRNNFAFGGVFALLLSFNPCTLSYLGVLISLSSAVNMFGNLLFFSLGLLLPSFAFAIFGKKLLSFQKRTRKVMAFVDKSMALLLMLSGFYLMLTIKNFGRYDVYVVGVMLGLVFLVLGRAYFVVHRKSDLLKWETLFLIFTFILIVFSTIYHC